MATIAVASLAVEASLSPPFSSRLAFHDRGLVRGSVGCGGPSHSSSIPTRRRPLCPHLSLTAPGPVALAAVSSSSCLDDNDDAVNGDIDNAPFVMPPPNQLVSDTPPDRRGIGVGIDLGTTNSAVSILNDDGVPIVIPVGGDETRTVPSVVTFLSSDEDDGGGDCNGGDNESEVVLVGNDAVRAEASNPRSTYRNVKRVLGQGGEAAALSAGVVPNLLVTPKAVAGRRGKKRRGGGADGGGPGGSAGPSLSQQLKDAEERPARLSLPLHSRGVANDSNQHDDSKGAKGDAKIGTLSSSPSTNSISPEEVSAELLKSLFRAAEMHCGTGEKVTRAVIGVPAYFHDSQRDATERACRLAGVPKVRLLAEPEAAALAYGIGREQAGAGDSDELVLVFDLGGGTFDVSVLGVGDGVTEVLATSGNAALGGSDFDRRIAAWIGGKVAEFGGRNYIKGDKKGSGGKGEGGGISVGDVADAMVRSAEAVRIHLSNNRVASLALPLTAEGWLSVQRAKDVLLSCVESLPGGPLNETGYSNTTHALCSLSRKTMEGLCKDEFQALLRPVREAAVMARALLPGDARPAQVEAALAAEEEYEAAQAANAVAAAAVPLDFDEFYEGEGKGGGGAAEDSVDQDTLLLLRAADLKARKREQQKGRKKARDVRSRERKFRDEKRKADDDLQRKLAASARSSKGSGKDNVKVRDGISGRPLSQVVLVGGATRMPAVGRLIAALTGVVPRRTVNPDEAVALGCAVQVGILDGTDVGGVMGGMQVLTPIQAAVMRALAKKRGMDVAGDDDEFDDDEFDEGVYY